MKILRIFFSLIFVFILFSNFSLPVPNELSNESSKKFRLAYTTSEGSNAITPINLQSGLAGSSIGLEHPPKSVAIHPDGSMAYILQDQSNAIICVDLLTGKPLHSIVLEKTPQRMIIVSKKGESYVTYEDSHEINVIDTETGISNLSMTLEGIPSRMTLTPDGKTLYVSYEGLKEVTPIDVASATIQPMITLNDIPKSIAVTKENLLAYLGESSPTKVSFYNLKSEEFPEPLEIEYDINQMKTNIHDINMDPDGETAYLTEENSQYIIPVNLKTHLMDRSITVDDRIKSLTVFPILGGDTSTTLSSSAAPAVFGQSITLTANVVSLVDTGIPTGTVNFYEGVTLLGTGSLDVNGNATFTTTFLLGSYSLFATYEGDSNYNPSSSYPPYFMQDVNQASTSTIVACSPNPSNYGNSVTFTATVAVVSPGTGTPTGSVEFYDGTALLGSGTLNGTSPYQATFSTSSLLPGSYSIKALYDGDTNFTGSSSPSSALTVKQGTTSTSVASSLSNSPFGDSVTFTATVTVVEGTGTPTGTVTFKDGTQTLATRPISAGTAIFSISTLTIGTHSITAIYNNDTNFSTSTSIPLSQVVSQGTTTTSVTSSANPSVYGEPVTFTAQVSVATGVGIPTGTVTFKDGITTLGTSSLNINGMATFSLATLSVNTHSITAIYNGDTHFSGSTSDVLSQVVNQAIPQVIVTSSLSPSNYGDLVTFTATVTIVNPPTTLGLPTGSVNFYDGIELIGSGALSASGTNTSKATFSLSTLNAGTHPITAQYSGDTNFSSQVSSAFFQMVEPVVSTATNLFFNSPNPTEYGQTVNLSATVTGSVSSPPSPPTGTVEFFDNGLSIGMATLSPASGNPNSSVATFPISTLSIGSHPITAKYDGDDNYPSSVSTSKTQSVVQGTTSSVVTTSGSPTLIGESVTFTVTVDAISPAAGAPSGTVSFYDGGTFLGTSSSLTPVTIGANSSVATFLISTLDLGTNYITGIYTGDANFTSSSTSPVMQIVGKPDISVGIIDFSSPPPGGWSLGDYVTFTAQVSPIFPGDGTPTGTVSFYEGSTLLGTGTLTGTALGGVTTFTTADLIVGTNNINAIYNGDANFKAAISPNYPLVVTNKMPTTATVTLLYSPAASGFPVPYLVTVAADPGVGQGTPTTLPNGGTVTLYDNNYTPPLQFTATVTNGIVTILESASDLQLTTAAAVTHSISAIYDGTNDPNYDSSPISPTVPQVVVPYDTTTTLTVQTNYSDHGSQGGVTLTAVASPALAIPLFPPIPNFPNSGETASFYAGTTFLGSAPVDLTTGTFTLTPTNFPFGTDTITAVFNGDDTFATSMSDQVPVLIQQTEMIPTTTTLTSSLSNSTAGQPVTFTTTVYIPSGMPPYDPAGTVTFFSDGIEIGTAILTPTTNPKISMAQLTVFNLPVGSHTIIATYNSDTNYAFSFSNTITHTVVINPTTLTLSIIPNLSSNPTPYGENVVMSAMVTSISPYSIVPKGTVTFSDGTAILGTVDLDASGEAIFQTSVLDAGTYLITATYNPTPYFNSSTSSQSYTIGQINPSTTFFTTPNPSAYGDTLLLTATIASPIATPTGNVTFYNGSTALGTVYLQGGSAALEITSPPAGFAVLKATYAGDTNFNSIDTTSVMQVISKAATLIEASYTPNPANFGAPVTLNVTVSPFNGGSGVPTGTVTASYGSQIIGSGTLSAQGTISFSTTNLPAGTLGIVISYSGDSNFLSSTAPLIGTVNQASSTTTLSSSENPVDFGESVTFSVDVVSSAGLSAIPTGIVTFFDGLTIIGTQSLDSLGHTTLTTSSLSVGNHTIKAVYSGDETNSGSVSSLLSESVDQAPTTTTMFSILNPSTYGDALTLTAEVFGNSSGAGIPTGTVVFKNGATTLGSNNLDNNGQATLTLSTSLGASSNPYTLTAEYSGDGNFNASTGALSQVVNKAATLIEASFSPNPADFGALVTLDVTVAPFNGGLDVPTGTVIASYGSQIIGSGTLSAQGTISFSTTSLPAGTLGIVISYSGDSNFLSSTAPLTGTVNQASSTTTLSSLESFVDFSEPVTFSVEVASSAGSTVIPTGVVTFFDGLTIIGTQSLDSLGRTTLTTSNLSVGNHIITAVYNGDETNSGSVSSPLSESIEQVSTITTISSILNPSIYGETVTLTALVSPNVLSAGVPTGTVTFAPGGTVNLNSNGEALLTTSSLPVGTNTITATYSSDSTNFSNSTTTANQMIAKTPTMISVVSATNPSNFGDTVSISGAITALNNGSTTLPAAGTTVTAFYGATVVGSGSLQANGQYSFSLNNLPAGTLAIEVKYPGDSNFIPSTITLTQTVSSDSSNITLATTPNPSTYGQSVILSSTVTLGSGQAPTGTITYYDGSVAIGIAPVGQPLVVSTFSPGIHSLTAVYSGSSNASGSTSNLVSQVVNKNIPTTAVVSSLNPSTYGSNVTFTATVTAASPGSGLPTGFVTFESGGTILGTGELNLSGQAIFSTSALLAGLHSIQAIYSGDINFASSTSSILPQLVQESDAATTTIVSSVPNPSVFGQDVSFFVAVTSPVGSPTGTVTFYDGPTPLSTVPLYDGSAIFSINTLSIGTHDMTAIYNGDTNFQPSLISTPYAQTVNVDTITATSIVTLTSNHNPSSFGEPVTFDVKVSGLASPPPYPTGFVSLYTGVEPLATLQLDLIGRASYTTAGLLPSENLEVVAFYSGDSNFSSAMTVLKQVVNPIGTTTTLVSSLNASNYGDTVTFTATASGGLSDSTPEGSFSFYDGTTLLDTALLNHLGVANFVTSTLQTGSHSITAVYNGSINYLSSSDTVNQAVNVEATSTEILTSFPSPSNIGESVTFIVRTFSNNGVPSGLVTFYDGAAPIGTVSLYEGTAIFSTTVLTAGIHSITAAYGGNANYSSSISSSYTQQIANVEGIIQSPRDLCGRQVVRKSRGPCKVDRVNILKWNPPGFGAEPQYYEIYRDEALTNRIAVISACSPTTYNDHHRRKGKTYTYYIVAVSEGNVSSAASITVKPYKKKHHHSSHHLANKKRRANNGGRRDARIPKFH